MDMKASSLGKLTTFSAETLDGKMFTQDDIAAKDLTVLNFWTTQCGPCIEEMPDLAKFEKSLPDNVTFATVCLLSDGQEEEIRDILKKAGKEQWKATSRTREIIFVEFEKEEA